MTKVSCIFCDIIEKKISSQIITESKYALAFRDVNPQSPTHILIIPKIHIESTSDLNSQNIHYFCEMSLLAHQVAKIENIFQKGYRWVINTGTNGGQTVNHLHLHVLGGRAMGWPPG